MRHLHRRTGYVDWDDVADVDWSAGLVHLRCNALRPLTNRPVEGSADAAT